MTLHILLIPGNVVNDKINVHITNSNKHFAEWAPYERPLDKVIACCSTMRGEFPC